MTRYRILRSSDTYSTEKSPCGQAFSLGLKDDWSELTIWAVDVDDLATFIRLVGKRCIVDYWHYEALEDGPQKGLPVIEVYDDYRE